jgi:hypothetical protein
LVAFAEAAPLDDALRSVFEAGHDGVYVETEAGLGWRIQPVQLAWSIVNSAAGRILFSEGGDLGELEDESVRCLDATRRLLTEHRVEGLTVSGFNGVALRGERRVTTPWGELRKAGPLEEQLHPYGEATASVVLESRAEVTVEIGEPGDRPAFDGVNVTLRRAARAVGLLPFAALVGVERDDQYLVADWLWQTSVFPSQNGWGWSGKPSRWLARFLQPIELNHPEEAALAGWAAKVDEGFNDTLQVAVGRTTSAVRERVDPQDALIDAVIACESLFGHGGETEVTFRVTSAIAVLLEPDPAERAAFRSRLGKIYGARSEVVHGGSVDRVKLNEFKEEAIRIAIRCCRVLFADRPDLLADSDRGMRIILRADAVASEDPSEA